MMQDSSMSVQGKPRGSGLILGLFFLFLANKTQKKNMMGPFSNHWIKLAWTGSLNPCQGQGLDLGREIHSPQIIFHRHR